ncbi:hypothetical protein BDC45DRAFT_103803 [Circinella umbellata]|nr:hypothetical protein BDC45DRAFT_103803 [Circinella umbellata]
MDRYISIRMVNIDHYLDDPGPMDRAFCPFSNTVLKKVPVIRIFGSTPSGQKACLHIHQSYPYFYVPFKLPSHNVEPEQIQREIFQFGNALNHAVSLAQGANQSGVNGDQNIAAITLVKGIPFYGYHSEPETYLKIHLLNPADKQRMADLLLKGVINNQIYQPYEAHIPYVLQFMMDYNLYGMNWVHLHPIIDSPTTVAQQQQKANSDNINNDNNDNEEKEKENVQLSLRFREPLFDEPKTILLSQTTINSNERSTSIYLNENEYFTSVTIPDELKWNKVGRTSYCELELDTTVMTIGNRLDLQQRNIHWNREVDVGDSKEKLINSLAGIWKDEANRRMARNESPTIPNTQQQDDILRDSNPKEWSSEETWRQLIDRYTSTINNKENLATSPSDAEEDNGLIYSSNIPTTFESVESLYPSQYYDIHRRQKVSHSSTMPPKVISNLSDWLQSQSSGSQQEQEQQQQVEHNLRVNESPYDIQAATPSRCRAWRDEGQAANNDNVNADKIHSLVRQQSSFQDDDITDEDILALARQLSEQEQEEQKEKEEQEQLEQQEGGEYHDDDFMWPSDSPFRKTPERKRLPQVQISYDDTENPDLFRPRKLDFHAEVAKIDARQKEAAQSSPFPRIDKENNISTTHTTIMNINENDNDRELQVSEIPPTPPRYLYIHKGY